MCAKCVDLEKKLRRYREIVAYRIDPQTTLSMRILIDELESERAANHSSTQLPVASLTRPSSASAFPNAGLFERD
jgi:hypothetical protein